MSVVNVGRVSDTLLPRVMHQRAQHTIDGYGH